MYKILFHIVLAIILFFVQNWISSRSYSRGYIRFSLLDDRDEALSMNFVLKVFGPVVFLILVAASLQYFNKQFLVDNIINVIYFYLLLRLVLIGLYERITIVNWPRILFHYLVIVIVSSIVYENFIGSLESLLPDLSEIKNEIWLLIILFLYQIGNGINSDQINNPLYEPEQAFLPELKNRKRKYIINQYDKLVLKYDSTIKDISNSNESFNLIIYSILIFENFNRPRIVRWVERLWVRVSGKEVTQGIMQVKSTKVLSDIKSIKKGTKYLYKKYRSFKNEEYSYNTFRRVIKRHCPDKKYIRQVLFISKAIIDNNKNKKKYKEVYDEIISEFNLYDYFD